jgi:hypothetical protein
MNDRRIKPFDAGCVFLPALGAQRQGNHPAVTHACLFQSPEARTVPVDVHLKVKLIRHLCPILLFRLLRHIEYPHLRLLLLCSSPMRFDSAIDRTTVTLGILMCCLHWFSLWTRPLRTRKPVLVNPQALDLRLQRRSRHSQFPSRPRRS